MPGTQKPSPSTSPSSASPASPARSTQVAKDGEKAPRLPNEHDESADSSGQRPRPSMKQAYKDVERGLVDTDKGPPMDQAYKRLRKSNA